MLTVHTAGRAGALVEALAGILTDVPDDPFRPDVVAVPTRGIERWLSQELSLRLGTGIGSDGICANVQFPSPYRLVADAVAVAAGRDPASDPWRRERLVWPLLAALDQCLDEPWMEVIARFVRAGTEPGDGRRMEAGVRIATLFAGYDAARPGMIRSWAQGVDVDAAGDRLAAGYLWQPELWRTLRQRVGVPAPAESLPAATEVLASGDVDLGLPPRLSVYGLTALPISYLRALAAMGQSHDIHLLLLNPSPVLWDRIGALEPEGEGPVLRAADPTARTARQPLLRSWGRDSRELQLLVRFTADDAATINHDVVEPPPTSLLKQLQAAVREDTPPGGDRLVLGPHDASVQIHSCHGPTRQVAVLRDAILHVLANDPTLEPRDIIVMCPDVEAYAPLVEATFRTARTATEARGSAIPDLRVRIADRSPVQRNPLVATTARLLELADGRLTAGAVLDFASADPVRRAFLLSEDHLEAITTLVDDMQVGWGLDAEHRAGQGLAGFDVRTWRFGLDRLLTGVFVSDDSVDLVGDALPLPGVEGADVDVAGRLAELVDRLGAVIDLMATPHPAGEWPVVLRHAVELVAAVEFGDDWQWAGLQRHLDEAFEGAGASVPLTLDEVRHLLAPWMAGVPSSAHHRTGDLTVATLVPMRSVPHRVVCLLGMDDGIFPRSPGVSGDDLLDLAPAIGDRDVGSEDRQLLLDALMAAGDHLIITFSGRDEHSNADRPPAVPVAELLDAIDTVARAADGAAASAEVLIRHPLQGFDPENFEAGAVLGDGPWGFDPGGLAGARALLSPPHPAPSPRLELPGFVPDDTVQVADLTAVLAAPVQEFVKRRLGFVVADQPEARDDTTPVELSALAQWGIGDRLLRGRLAGHTPASLERAARRRGDLPPGRLGRRYLPGIEELAGELADAALTAGYDPPAATVRVDVPLPGGRRVIGAVPGVFDDRHIVAQYSRVRAKHLLAAYIHLVVLAAADPSTRWRALVIGRAARGDGAQIAALGPLGRDPRRLLEELVDLYDRCLEAPAPLFPATSHVFVTTPPKQRLRKARAEWEGGFRWGGEGADPAHVLIYGKGSSFDDILARPPAADEVPPDWPEATSRFEALALRLWGPVLEAGETP